MTFSCNQCQTRYHIADEKVRGKILQVRCRACQNLVEVKDPELANARTPASSASMTLLGISAIPKESSAFAKPATAPSTALPAPSPSTARPASPMPAYAQPRPSYAPPQAAVAKPAPPQPIAPKPPAPLASRPAPSYAQQPSVSKPAPLAYAQPNKPAAIAARPPTPSPAVRPPSLMEPRPHTNGVSAQIPASIMPVPPPAEPKQWYYNRKGERQGPFRFSELTALIAEGKVRPEDYAWSPEIVNWKQVKDIELFASCLPAEPPPFEAATLLPLPPKPQSPQPPKPPPTPDTTQPSIALPPIPVRAPSQPFMAAVQAAPPIPVRAPSQPYLPVVQPPQLPPRAPSQPYLPVVQPVQVRAPSQPYLPVVQAPSVPQAPSAPPKPPTIVKSQVAVQPSLPGPSPSAAVLQTSMRQPAGPTAAPSNMFAANDAAMFGAIPDAADFKSAPIREMSAIIPISAMKPPLAKRIAIPALVLAAFIGVAALAFTVGQDSTKTPGNQPTNNPEENTDSDPKPNISDIDIKGLDGLAPQTQNTQPDPSNPKNNKNNKKGDPSNGNDPIASLGNPDKKNTAVDAKTAAENAKAADLFSGKKTAVTPTLTPDNKTNTDPEPVVGGSEKVAMQLINETNIKPCIDRAFTNGDLRKETRLNVSLKTDANGKITSFSVGNAPAGSSIENCLKSSYSRAPLKEAGGVVSLNFPIIASPSF